MVPNSKTYVQFLNFKKMKKYLFIAIIAIGGLATSCTTDNENFETPKVNDVPKHVDYQDMVIYADTTGIIDTGGQGGSTPIKP